MRSHLNDHCWNHASGAVPESYKREHNLIHCSFCNALSHARYNGTCYTCRPAARARAAAEALSARLMPATSSETQPEAQHPQTPSLDTVHTTFVPTLRHVPKELRQAWGRCLARTVAKTAWHNSVEAWTEMQMLVKCVLCTMPRAGKAHHNQRIAFTRSRLNRWLAGERGELWYDRPAYKRPKKKQAGAEATKALQQQRCIDLCREGGFSAACKTLTKGSPLGFTPAVMRELRAKHPPNSSPPDSSRLRSTDGNLTPDLTSESVEKAVRSFHRLSGAGPSGLRPLHLQEAMSTCHRDELLEHLGALVQLLAKGRAPASIAPFLAGASLTALPKKDASVRPVAVGETLRRLVSKCLCREYQDQAREFFFPLQIGVAHPLGTEIGLQTARQWCERNASNRTAVFLKADFTNAFNTVDRQAFLEQCAQHFPGLSAWASWCYATPSHLLCDGQKISSESGVQQGDPLGPLLFALALQPVLQQLRSDTTAGGLQLVFSYLDDACFAGEQHAVASAFTNFQNACRGIGLELNMSKCEVIPAAGPHSAVNPALFPSDIKWQTSGDFELLGGPIGGTDYCNAHTAERVAKATKLLSALGELHDPQVALLLLRHCASFGKLVFSTRVVPPSAHHDALQEFDRAVRACFESFTCLHLDDQEWSLATLATKSSGLGLRSCLQHSHAAFLSSRASCHKLCRELDPDHVWEIDDPGSAVAQALRAFNDKVAVDDRLAPPPQDSTPRQRELSAALDRHTRDVLKAAPAADPYRQAHLELTSTENAGQWLHNRFSKEDPVLFRTSLQRWLRMRIFDEEFSCPLCDGVVDVYGDHCLVCSGGGDRTKRHNLLRNNVFHFCRGAGFAPELEKPGLLHPRPMQGALPEDGIKRENPEARRPADVYLPRWRQGTAVAFDFAVTSGLRHSNLAASLIDGSAAAKSYEDYKEGYQDARAMCIAEGFGFIPMVIEAVGGGWGPAATKVLYELAKAKSLVTGEHKSLVLSQLHQSLGAVLHRENARSILRRCCVSVEAAPPTCLTAAATLQSPAADAAEAI